MPVNCKADDGAIAFCSGAPSPGSLFDLIALDDTLGPAGFKCFSGSETVGAFETGEQADPANQ